MLILVPKGWELPEREATPESVYANRRRFLGRACKVAGVATLAGTGSWSKALAGESPAEDSTGRLDAPRNEKFRVDRKITNPLVATRYNNFYEFSENKQAVWKLAKRFRTRPWQVEVKGLVEKPFKLDVEDLIGRMKLEERVYRFRCVEAWSMVIPWVGFPMKQFIAWAKPLSSARYVRMVTFNRPSEAPGIVSQPHYPWPYHEGLTLEEATNELAMLVVGMYGRILPNQNGAPLRLIVPWKYGFKSIKSIVRFEFVKKKPRTFWNRVVPNEYDFWANINPKVPHARWSQATEKVVETGERIPTLLYNGYKDYVAHLYS